MKSNTLEYIYHKVENKERLSTEEALTLYKKASWLKIGELAANRRNQMVGSGHASYTLFGTINYTSICNIGCTFCSFQDKPDDPNAYTLDKKQIFAKIEHGLSMGSDQIFFQGGVNPRLPLEYYLKILMSIKNKYNIHIRGFSPVELKSMSNLYQLNLNQLLRKLKDAGLDSVPGAGAEILEERVRKELSPNKCTSSEWAEILTTCHREGLRGSANIVIGSIETDEEIIMHLDKIRNVQDETGGFLSFIPWKFQQQTKNFHIRKVPHHEYLKLLGISRLFLDNIKNIEVSVMVLGKDVGKLALQMGANDISSPVIEENVLKSYGIKTEKQAQKLIREANLLPKRRDFNYTFTETLPA